MILERRVDFPAILLRMLVLDCVIQPNALCREQILLAWMVGFFGVEHPHEAVGNGRGEE